MLKLDKVRKSFGGKLVVAEASFSAASGDILCLTGPSGAGKSTLLELMAGILKPDAGSIVCGGAVALAFQDDALIPWLNAEANIRYALPASLPARAAKKQALEWLDRFGLAAQDLPAAMSGGMRRRLGMARAFAVERPILLLDEPFAFLDPERQADLAREAAAQAARGRCVVMATHTMDPLEKGSFRSLAVEGSPVRVVAA